MEPHACRSGEEALEYLKKGDVFDIAILDLQMPKMDGISLAHEIRKLRNPETLPLVMLTSLGGHVQKEDNGVELFAASLVKPIKPSVLYDILMNVFENQPLLIRKPEVSISIDKSLAKRHPLQILLAEDNPVNQKAVLKILERMGYRADIAANGIEVIQALERQSYDLIFMDIQMPHMNGYEATKAIRKEGVKTPIVALTANAMKGDDEKCFEAGCDDYLAKPFAFSELLARLRALTRRPKQTLKSVLKVSDLSLNPFTFEVKRGKVTIELSKTEFALLEYLMRNAEKVLTKDKARKSATPAKADQERPPRNR